MTVMMRTASIVLALSIPGAAFASSEQAWDQFTKDLQKKCSDATGDMFRRPMVAIDPTGTQSYGVAIVYGRSKEAKGPAAVICVVDKKTGKVEIGSELDKDVVRIRKPKGDDKDQGSNTNKNKNGNGSAQDDSGDDEDDQQ